MNTAKKISLSLPFVMFAHEYGKICKDLLWILTGGLSDPSKMPGGSWSISAVHCKRGSALRKIAGTVCKYCYALKGRYVFPTTVAAHARRLEAYNTDPIRFAWAMVRLITGDYSNTAKLIPWFRWFDSGDLQSTEMLNTLTIIAENTPDTDHWMPTREKRIVKDFLRSGGSVPENMVIRISQDCVNKIEGIHIWDQYAGICHSMVYDDTLNLDILLKNGIKICPVSNPLLDGKTCDHFECRMCWDRNIKVIAYHAH